MEAPSKEAANAARARKSRRAYLILAVVAIGVAGAYLGHRELTKGKQDTDDAQVESDVVPLSARVSGVILTQKVTDNQQVKAGDVLFEIDPADLDLEVQRTSAELDAANAQKTSADQQVAIVESTSGGALASAKAAVQGASASVKSAADSTRAAEASVARAQADLTTANADLTRAQGLFAKEAITRRDLEHAEQAKAVAQASLDNARANLDMSRSNKGMAESRIAEAQGRVTSAGPVSSQVAAAHAAADLAAAHVKSAETALAKAKLNRSYARVTSPVDGVISRLGVHAGQSVVAGMALVMIVPNETYVIANFKEVQIGEMKPGDPVDIEIDAFKGEFAGVVETLSPATGARFSLIPPDNATGNFVKVVQRVPVKIKWTRPPGISVRPGLSAYVTVHTDK
ncbi:MAG TPA: HlyD family secretion protein [Kofleriaceae bacterium]|jgi:membrane fusion protein (multidrug efflux system)